MKRLFAIITLLGLLFAATAIADYFVYPLVVRPDAHDFNKGQNGLWMGSRWYLGKVDETDIAILAQRLRDSQVKYAYFHVRDIDRHGLLRFHCQKEALKLVQLLHALNPKVKVIAWIGAVSNRSGGDVDLSFERVRSRMAGEAKWLTDSCGFDGVQWDYEICLDGDPDFVKLLDQTRKSLPPGKMLSIAAPILWSSKYYRPITRNCDQIAVMCYDTVAYFPRAYVSLVAREAIRVTNAVAKSNPRCRVILGVPTYEDSTRAHNKHSENLLMALVGVKQGLADRRTKLSSFAGIAPYADFTTDENKWRIYTKYWLCD